MEAVRGWVWIFSGIAQWGGRGLFERGDLSNLEKTMVSVLHKKLEYKVEQLKNKKAGGHTEVDQNQI